MKVNSGLLVEAVQRIEIGFVPLISDMPGFVEYTVMQAGEEEGLTISVFETQEQVEESNRRAAEWAKENLAPLGAGPYEMVAAGNIRVRS
jgi:hypothetical protein